MRRALGLLIAAAVCAQGAWCAPWLDEQSIRRLVVMEDVAAAPLLAEQIGWLEPGGIVVSGWERWPDQPALVCFDCHGLGLPQAPRPLSFFPFFALSPSCDRLAHWRRPAEQEQAGGQLMAVDLPSRTAAPLGEPASFASAGPLVMLADGTVIASYQSEGGDSVLVKVSPEGAQQTLAEFGQEVCEGLALEPEGSAAAGGAAAVQPQRTYVLARCAGEQRHCYRIDVAAGVWAEVEPQRCELHDPLRAGLPIGVRLDSEDGLVRDVGGAPARGAAAAQTQGGAEEMLLATEVQAACSWPGASAIIYADAGGLGVVSLTGRIKRHLWGAQRSSGARAHKLAWSPDGVYVAHCYQREHTGDVRRAALGTEEVKVRLNLPAESRIKPTDRVWVAPRFRFDEQGRVIEPVWETLKALLRVQQVAQAEEGFVADTVSEGIEGGVVERLTGSNRAPRGTDSHVAIGDASRPPTAWVQTFTAEPLPELRAWVQGETVVGTLLSVVVTRRRLMAPG